MNRRTTLKCISAAFIFVVVILVVRKKASAKSSERFFFGELEDFLQNLKQEALCRNRSDGLNYFYLAKTRQCAYCGNVCDESNVKDYLKQECEQKCQVYTALKEMRQLHREAQRKNDVQQTVQMPDNKGLIDRINELEKLTTIIKALDDWKRGVDSSLNLVTLNMDEVRGQLKRVEKGHGDMIKELQDAMSMVELAEKMLLLGLSLGCGFLLVTLAVLYFCPRWLTDGFRNDGSKTKFV